MTYAFVRRPGVRALVCATLAFGAGPALAQRASENVVAAASDGFGTAVGDERVGIYSPTSVRGFSPVTAGNRRIEGLYVDTTTAALTNRLVSGSAVRVGLTALAYPLPAPSGIVDYRLRAAGPEPVASVVAARTPFGGHLLEADVQAPLLADRLRIAFGASHAASRYSDGRETTTAAFAAIPTWRSAGVVVTGFYGYAETGGDSPPLWIPRGSVLPPEVDTHDFRGQPWADNAQRTHTYGLLASWQAAEALEARVGLFETRSMRTRSFSDLFVDITPDGAARNVIIAEPRLPARWTSGEARLAWRGAFGGAQHTLLLTARARDKRLEIGGGAAVDLGPATVGRLTPYPKPDFVFGTPTVSDVRQWTLGAAWLVRRGPFEANLGLQRTDYRSTTIRDGRAARSEDTPLLYNATVTYAPRPWFAAYAGAATGLEETASPPANALNRDDAVPASRTKQFDAGVRLGFGGLRLVAGGFEIERPYYALGAERIYGELGRIRNRGLEASLAGQATPRLTIVAGVVLMDAQVLGEAREAGRTGRRPVTSTTRTARVDLDWRTPVAEGLSLTLGLQHGGPAVATSGGVPALGGAQLRVPDYTTVDLGARWRFEVRETPVTARILLANAFDSAGFTPTSGQAFQIRERRRLTLQLTADL